MAHLPQVPFYVDAREGEIMSGIYQRSVRPGFYIYSTEGMWGPFETPRAALAHMDATYPEGQPPRRMWWER